MSEIIYLRPLEGIEWNNQLIPLGCSKELIIKVFGPTEIVLSLVNNWSW